MAGDKVPVVVERTMFCFFPNRCVQILTCIGSGWNEEDWCNQARGGNASSLNYGLQIHGKIIICGFQSNRVVVIYDRNTRRSRGFAFVTMSSPEDAIAVIENLDGREHGGRTLRVNSPEKPRTRERPTYTGSTDEEHKVFIGNLAWSVTDEILTEVFSEHGNVVGAKVLYDKTGRSRGFGFVSFSSHSEVEATVASLNGMEVEGRPMQVDIAIGRRGYSQDTGVS